MRVALVLSAILGVGIIGDSLATCGSDKGDNRLNQTQVRDALSGKRILATAPGGQTWHEDHCTVGGGSGPANFYKVGDGSAVDPRALRGTWQILGTGNNAEVQYNYFRAPPNDLSTNLVYTRQMWVRSGGSTVDFCDGAALIASITSSAGAGTPCP